MEKQTLENIINLGWASVIVGMVLTGAAAFAAGGYLYDLYQDVKKIYSSKPSKPAYSK